MFVALTHTAARGTRPWWRRREPHRALTLASLLLARSAVETCGGPASTTLETGPDGALHTSNLHVGLPYGVSPLRLEFTFGFGTTESVQPAQFLDALSLTLQPGSIPRAALLLTADAHGVAWAPANPEGLAFREADLQFTRIAYEQPPGFAWPTTIAYAVTVVLPSHWLACDPTLVVDLFDNRNALASHGYVRDARVIPAHDYFLLESSSDPAGPYAAENAVTHQASLRQFRLDVGGQSRYFRLRTESRVALRLEEPDAAEWRFTYEFPDPSPSLVSSPRPEGPYGAVTGAEFDPAARTFRILPSGNARFFRIRSSVRASITRVDVIDGDLIVAFEYRPEVFQLQSSAQSCGPFADDFAAQVDRTAQTIRVPRNRHLRFFRIAHSARPGAVRLRTVVEEGSQWHVTYDEVQR